MTLQDQVPRTRCLELTWTKFVVYNRFIVFHLPQLNLWFNAWLACRVKSVKAKYLVHFERSFTKSKPCCIIGSKFFPLLLILLSFPFLENHFSHLLLWIIHYIMLQVSVKLLVTCISANCTSHDSYLIMCIPPRKNCLRLVNGRMHWNTLFIMCNVAPATPHCSWSPNQL